MRCFSANPRLRVCLQGGCSKVLPNGRLAEAPNLGLGSILRAHAHQVISTSQSLSARDSPRATFRLIPCCACSPCWRHEEFQEKVRLCAAIPNSTRARKGKQCECSSTVRQRFQQVEPAMSYSPVNLHASLPVRARIPMQFERPVAAT